MFGYSWVRNGLALLLMFLAASGCGTKNNVVKPDKSPTEDRLLRFGTAYLQASYRLGRAPKDFEEMKSDLKGDVPDDFLRSPNDGEEFVIIWGVAYHQLKPDPRDPLTVAAYEKRGVDGKRYVLRFPPQVARMTDEELKAAVYPPGFGPPS